METNDIFEQMACRYDTEDRVNTAKIIVQAVRSELVGTKGKYLSPDEIENQAETGKIGFNERRSQEQAELKKAIATAILVYEDGIYRVFIGDNEVSSLDEPLTLKEDDLLTFIRLTMLSGRMW